MKNQNLKTLNDLINKGNILTTEQVEEFLTTIVDFLSKNKKDFDTESNERLTEMKEVMKYIEVQHKEVLSDWEAKLDTKSSELYTKIKSGFNTEITKAKEIIQELRAIKLQDGYTPIKGVDYFDGKDADETKIVNKVLKKLPKSKDYSATGIRDLIESLEDDDRLDALKLKNLPEMINPIMAGAGGRLLSQMNDVNVTGLTNNSILVYNTTTSQWEVGAATGTGTVTSVATGTGLTGGTITGTGTISLSTPLQPIANLTGNAGKFLRVNAGESAVEYATVSGSGTVTSVTSANGDATVATSTTTPVITIVSAPKLTTGRTIAITGDLTYTSPSFDGSGNVTAAGTLATVNSTVGSFTNVSITVNAKGLITAASNGTAPVTSITGTADRITITGTTTPTIDIASTYVGQTSITTLGTITTGTWSGSSIALNKITALTASRAVASDASGFLVSSATTATELGYVSGVTSSIQTQLNAKGAGTVTSVGFTGGIISVATATTTPALTVAGTSGGIPYFSSASTWATSAALAANAIVIGGGAGVAPATTTTGTGVLTALGINVGSAGAFVTFNGALGTPSSGTVTNLTGTASININGTVGATTPTTGSFTTVTTSGNIELGNASDTTLSRVSAGVMAVEGVTVATSSNTLTLTNKRPQPRTASSTTASTLTPDLSSANVYYRTTQTATLTINAPTGTPVIGETIAIYVDSAGAQTLTMDSAYKVFGAAFPATTTAGKTLMITAQYTGSEWATLWANKV